MPTKLQTRYTYEYAVTEPADAAADQSTDSCGPPFERRRAANDTDDPGDQLELKPDEAAVARTLVRYPLAAATRRFGKVLDTRTLWPGDLVLMRRVPAPSISRGICEAQQRFGYAWLDSRWTHAATYAGMLWGQPFLIEADVGGCFLGSVRLVPLADYCQGQHVLRCRRPNLLRTELDGYQLSTCALTRLSRPYAVHKALWIWLLALLRSRGPCGSLWSESALFTSFICSTLYAEAFKAATRSHLPECHGICLPACLSVAAEFTDLALQWTAIV